MLELTKQKIIYHLKDNDSNNFTALNHLKNFFLSIEVDTFEEKSQKKTIFCSEELVNKISRLIDLSTILCDEILLVDSDILINGLMLRFLNASK